MRQSTVLNCSKHANTQ